MRLLAGMTVCIPREIKVFKKKNGEIAGTLFDTGDGCRQLVLMSMTSGTVCACVSVCV